HLVATWPDHQKRHSENHSVLFPGDNLRIIDDLVPEASGYRGCYGSVGKLLGTLGGFGKSRLVLSRQGIAASESEHDLPTVDNRSDPLELLAAVVVPGVGVR